MVVGGKIKSSFIFVIVISISRAIEYEFILLHKEAK